MNANRNNDRNSNRNVRSAISPVAALERRLDRRDFSDDYLAITDRRARGRGRQRSCAGAPLSPVRRAASRSVDYRPNDHEKREWRASRSSTSGSRRSSPQRPGERNPLAVTSSSTDSNIVTTSGGLAGAIPGDALDAKLPSPRVTLTHALLGSPRYMAPEQFSNPRDVDGRADIWSLGAILHELVSGAPAFRGETLAEVCSCILERHPAPVAQVNATVASDTGPAHEGRGSHSRPRLSSMAPSYRDEFAVVEDRGWPLLVVRLPPAISTPELAPLLPR